MYSQCGFQLSRNDDMTQYSGSSRTVSYIVAAIAVFAVATALFVFPEQYNRASAYVAGKTGFSFGQLSGKTPFVFGLDLRGGAHLVYEADTKTVAPDEVADAIEGVRDVIERRVNSLGVSEPIIQTNRSGDAWRIIVELAGVKDVSQAISAIGETPVLEFKEESGVPPRALTEEEKTNLKKANEDQKNRAVDLLTKALLQQQNFEDLAKANTEDPRNKETGGKIGEVTLDGVYGKLADSVKVQAAGSVATQIVENEEGFNIVKLNGVRDAEMVDASHILICYKGAKNCDKETDEIDARTKAEELYATVKPATFEVVAKVSSTEPGANETGGALGFFERTDVVKEFADAAFALKDGEISKPVKSEYGYHLIYRKAGKTEKQYDISRILIAKTSERDILPQSELWASTGLTGRQLKKAQLEFNQQTNVAVVAIEFDEEGKKLFAEITKRNIGKSVAIFLDGMPISVPTVETEIPDGKAVIQGNFTVQTAKQLALRLQAGALPVPISLVSQSTVGASMGEKTLEMSVLAGLIGFALVSLFMVLYYRLPGLIAVASLTLYVLISLAVFKMIPVTLTAAAIAGFILSIGMAIDANVLIFERVKEELQAGRGLKDAIEEGFTRAWFSIRASNMSSIITALILMNFSTSVVKGFAITLVIGILISMFSAITVTRYLLRFVVNYVPRSAVLFLGIKRS